jgi:membrane-bound serine protease (ClpP class)
VNRTLSFIFGTFLLFIVGVVLFNVAEGLSYFTLTMMSTDTLGIIFIILAFGCFVMEMLTPGFGLFTALGIAALIVGSIILFHVAPLLIIMVDIMAIGTVAFLVDSIVKSQRRRVTTGMEEMVGKTAEVKETLSPAGMVLFEGELWKAVSEEGTIGVGEEVEIHHVDGLKLCVGKKTIGGC